MNEFASAGLTAGQLNAIVKKLGGQDMALRFLRESVEIKFLHIINCVDRPFVPDDDNDWSVTEHNQDIQELKWDPTKVTLYISECRGMVCDIQRDLEGKPVLNANVLDYLLAHPELIPEEWKSKSVFFLGTIYLCCHSEGYSRCVRYLYWRNNRWCWGHEWFANFGPTNASAVLLAA